MLSLSVVFAVVAVSVLYAIKVAKRVHEELKVSNMKYSETEAESKCTFEDYRFFELARK